MYTRTMKIFSDFIDFSDIYHCRVSICDRKAFIPFQQCYIEEMLSTTISSCIIFLTHNETKSEESKVETIEVQQIKSKKSSWTLLGDIFLLNPLVVSQHLRVEIKLRNAKNQGVEKQLDS